MIKRSHGFLGLILPLILIAPSTINAESEVIFVGTSPLYKLLIGSENSAPATIISLNHPIISAEITGRALKIQAETGDFVKKGKKLVSLDCRGYFLAKKQAEASLYVAKTQLNYSTKQFKRNQNLVRQGTIPRQLFEKAEAGRLTALADIQLKQASIETALLAISRCQVSAPFSGQITKRFVQKGQLLTAGTPLFQIMQSAKLEIKTNLSPTQVTQLDESPLLKFVVSDKHFKTVVRSVIRNIDESTRTQEVRLSLPKGTKASAGLSGRIQWNSKDKLLPAEYIIRRGNQLGVMIAENIVEGIGKAKFYAVEGASEGQASMVLLPENSAVITKNRYRIKDGQQIKVQLNKAVLK